MPIDIRENPPQVGDRFAGADGDTYIVAHLDEEGCPFLLEDFDVLSDPETFDWDLCTWEWAEGHWGPLRPVEGNPQMTEVVERRRAREQVMAAIVARVPRAEHRLFYNTLWALSRCSGKLLNAEGVERERWLGHQASELRTLVRILGSRDESARLLNMERAVLDQEIDNPGGA